MACARRRTIRAAIAACAIALAGCTTQAAINKPLSPALLQPPGQSISSGGYRLAAMADNGTDPGLLVFLAFSGGGKRSAAFAYGVLRGLRDIQVSTANGPRRLLDEVDLISSVSGGSFPAAYYGLHHDKTFTDFERDFLKRDIEAYIYGTYLLPWHFAWMFSSDYGTNDRMAEVYDELMFHGAKFSALSNRPMLAIDATDVNQGVVFPFLQDQFDLICSDLNTFPIARAVAASNGFPVLFTPITLKSYAGQCGGRQPPWLSETGGDTDALSRRHYLAQSARTYLDPERTRYVHLLDGGIADNLAMRSIISIFLILSADEDTMKRIGLVRPRRVLLISADGQSANDNKGAREPTLTSIGQIFTVVSGTQIDSYNFETLVLARAQTAAFADSLKRVRCTTAPSIDGHPCDDVEYAFVRLSLAGISDTAARARLQKIPTGLTLDDADVDALVNAGETEVRNATALRDFIR